MRQVNRDELIYNVVSALRTLSPSLIRDFGITHRSTQARAIAASIIVDKALGRFEVLSERELPLMGDETYSQPVSNMLGESTGPLRYDETKVGPQ